MPFNPKFTSNDVFNDVGDNSLPSGLASIWNWLTGRSQQAGMQMEQQQFDEYMYNEYNSPVALKRQFEEAGLNTNLLGSTSFGTAQSAAGAPAMNGITSPLNAATQAVEDVASAASLAADPALKGAQTVTEMTLPKLNNALIRLYGADANIKDTEYQFLVQTFDWRVQNTEWNAKTAQQTYYQAVQMVKNREQEYQNMLKENQLIGDEAEKAHWDAMTKKQVHDFFVEHGWFPDQNYLDYIYNEMVVNGDWKGFNRFNRAQQMLYENENREAARFGKYGNTLKIGPVEVPIEYLLQSGKDLGEFVDEIRGTDNTKPNFRWPWQKDESPVPSPVVKKKSASEMNVSDAAKFVAQNLDKPSTDEMIDALVDDGYSASWVHSHIGEIMDKLSDYQH